jgi:adenylate cyclase
MRTKYLLLIFLIFSASNTYAQMQGQARIDSLINMLQTEKDDTDKVKALQKISWSLLLIDPEMGIKYGKQCLALSERLGWEKGKAIAYFSLGGNYENVYDLPMALKYYLLALKLFRDVGADKGIANVLASIGNIYSSERENEKALDFLSQALKKYEDIGQKNGIARCYCNIGTIYCDGLKNYPKALEYMLRGLELSEEIDDKFSIAINLGNIGGVYECQRNYAMAITYFENGLKLSREIGEVSTIAFNLENIGSLYLSIVEDGEMGAGQETFSNNSELAPGKYVSKISIPSGKQALVSGAIRYLQESISIAVKISDLDRMEKCYGSLAKAYKLNGDYKKALEASDNQYAIRDSVFSKDNKEKILKIGMKNDYERRRLADSLNTAEKQKIAAINLKKQKNYTYLGIAGILLLGGFSFFIVRERSKSETARKQSDNLLLNILPEVIAEELKTTGTTTAKHYNNVTVLFTDFVNFTEAGENMSAQGLIDELHTCFKMFDEITSKYDIEKIKTIGDAYLCVCGLPSANPRHAENVVRAAVEINTFMTDRLAKMGSERTFAVRIGIHSGSVVAGIVGVKKFAYDIWGDTVNTAARMEQNSEAGKINISETTYELVKDIFACEYRGEVEAKGKGVMKMYFVV